MGRGWSSTLILVPHITGLNVFFKPYVYSWVLGTFSYTLPLSSSFKLLVLSCFVSFPQGLAFPEPTVSSLWPPGWTESRKPLYFGLQKLV